MNSLFDPERVHVSTIRSARCINTGGRQHQQELECSGERDQGAHGGGRRARAVPGQQAHQIVAGRLIDCQS